MSSEKNHAADFERLARQYWSAWSQFAPGTDAAASMPGFKEGLAWWSRLAGDNAGVDASAAVERMSTQAGDWFGAMQQLAAQFAGRDAGPGDVASAWKSMLGGLSGNPMAQLFGQMQGANAHGIDQWQAQAAPFLAALQGEGRSWLQLPAFGLGREHQERLQALARAQAEYQQRSNDYNGQLARAGKLAFERFERKLGERSEPGRQLESARALFDLWIDAAEEAWAEVALSPEFRSVYAALVNAQMRLRAGVQREVEQVAGSFGLPTRSEIDASHRKLAQLERELRMLKAQHAGAPAARTQARAPDAPSPVARKATKPAPKAAPKPAARAKSRAAPAAARRNVMPQVAVPKAANASKSRAARSTAARKGR